MVNFDDDGHNDGDVMWKHAFNVDTLLAADVLSEDTILRWYNEAHLSKGKSVFLEQMKQFVEWLKNAEEG